MKKVELIKYSELIDHCGQPGNKSNMVKKKFPFSLKLNGSSHPSSECINFFGHPLIVDPVIEALKEILYIYGLDFIIKNNLDWYGGCYENRPSRGSNRVSVHAWGMAIDYLPQLGKFNSPSLIPYHIIRAFKNRGFEWGGDWSPQDGMHFTSVIE